MPDYNDMREGIKEDTERLIHEGYLIELGT
jgi:hypothetical protein